MTAVTISASAWPQELSGPHMAPAASEFQGLHQEITQTFSVDTPEVSIQFDRVRKTGEKDANASLLWHRTELQKWQGYCTAQSATPGLEHPSPKCCCPSQEVLKSTWEHRGSLGFSIGEKAPFVSFASMLAQCFGVLHNSSADLV